MDAVEQALPGVFILRAEPKHDERGYFARVFDAAVLRAAGLDPSIAERAVASNDREGTIRGLHFSAEPHTEAKIVTCLRGAIYDVAVDLRAGSPSFGRWAAFELSDDRLEALYIPRGFAHGYQTLRDDCLVGYELSAPYVAEAARGVRYDDPHLAIPWPRPISLLSERDRAFGLLVDAQPYLGDQR